MVVRAVMGQVPAEQAVHLERQTVAQVASVRAAAVVTARLLRALVVMVARAVQDKIGTRHMARAAAAAAAEALPQGPREMAAAQGITAAAAAAAGTLEIQRVATALRV